MRALTVEESEVLEKLREVVRSDEVLVVPSLKSVDRKKVMVEVEMVEGVMHNILSESMSVTDVNRLLYAGSYVVALRLDLMKERKGMVKKKPAWQRRLEESIVRWRRDLGRVEEVRRGAALKEKVRRELERRYGLLEKGALSVSTMLKGKIRAGSVKIQNFVGKGVACQQNNLFKNNQSHCTRS